MSKGLLRDEESLRWALERIQRSSNEDQYLTPVVKFNGSQAQFEDLSQAFVQAQIANPATTLNSRILKTIVLKSSNQVAASVFLQVCKKEVCEDTIKFLKFIVKYKVIEFSKDEDTEMDGVERASSLACYLNKFKDNCQASKLVFYLLLKGERNRKFNP